jgi:hypothetical protein
MVRNKKIDIDEFSIDYSLFLKKWWQYRRLVIFGTAIVSLLSLFFLVLLNQTLKSGKYTSSILRGDLGKNNSTIIASLKSTEIIEDVLKTLSIKLEAKELLEQLIIKNGTDPLTDSLKDRIASLENTDIKKLSLKSVDFNLIIKELSNISEDLITIDLFHSPLNISDDQAMNILNKLVLSVNKNIIFHTSFSDENEGAYALNKIDLSIFDGYRNPSELISILDNTLTTISSNLDHLRDRYQGILVDIDLNKINNLTTIAKKIAYETSKQMGMAQSVKPLDIEIQKVERNIEDLMTNLDYLDKKSISKLDTDKISNEKEFSGNIEFEGGTFEKILSIGSSLELNTFRLKTLEIVQKLQFKKNSLNAEKQLLSIPFEYDEKDLTQKKLLMRVKELSADINRAINQVYKFNSPQRAIQFLRNPEIVDKNFKLITLYIKTTLILSLISFFCLSFIAILLPLKKL